MSAVCEAARNVACTGARPAAVTNCLNFGNPEDPEIGYELAEAIAGMAAACRALGAAGRVGQRLALQRARRPADPARRRSSASSACSTTPSSPCASASARPATSCSWPAPAPARWTASDYQKVILGRGGRAHPRARPRGRAGAARLPGRRGRAQAAAKRARRRRRRPGGRGGRVGDGGRHRRARRGGATTSSARATAGSSSRPGGPTSRRCASSPAGVPLRRLGAVGGERDRASARPGARWPRPSRRTRRAIPRIMDGERLMCGVFGIYAPSDDPIAASRG